MAGSAQYEAGVLSASKHSRHASALQTSLIDFTPGEVEDIPWWEYDIDVGGHRLMFNRVNSKYRRLTCPYNPRENTAPLPDMATDGEVLFVPVSYDDIISESTKRPIYVQSTIAQAIFPSDEYRRMIGEAFNLDTEM
ncbi:MAG: hypothetical protein GXO25_07165, partial [Euryarchaeota archaeon]|nr:hypothetical protein [Euryarchaeota archaeon]